MKKTSYLIGLVATSVALLPAIAFAKTSKVSGTVSAINSGTSISIMGMGSNSSTTYTVDLTNAKFVRHFGAKMAITDIQTNDKVTVAGTVSGSTITATTLRDDSLQGYNGNFIGTVSAINGTGFTLMTPKRATQNISTDASTKIELNGKADQLSDLTVGETVKVSGVWDRKNSNVEANVVNMVVTAKNFTGTITGMPSGTTVTMMSSGTSYTIDLSKAKLIRHYGAPMVFTDLQVNDKVTVRGSMLNGDITATNLRDDSLQAVDGTFVGSVTAINGTSFTLLTPKRATQTVNTNASTTYKMNKTASQFSSITVGASVTVKGVWDSANSNVLAHYITFKAPATPATSVAASTTVSQ